MRNKVRFLFKGFVAISIHANIIGCKSLRALIVDFEAAVLLVLQFRIFDLAIVPATFYDLFHIFWSFFILRIF